MGSILEPASPTKLPGPSRHRAAYHRGSDEVLLGGRAPARPFTYRNSSATDIDDILSHLRPPRAPYRHDRLRHVTHGTPSPRRLLCDDAQLDSALAHTMRSSYHDVRGMTEASDRSQLARPGHENCAQSQAQLRCACEAGCRAGGCMGHSDSSGQLAERADAMQRAAASRSGCGCREQCVQSHTWHVGCEDVVRGCVPVVTNVQLCAAYPPQSGCSCGAEHASLSPAQCQQSAERQNCFRGAQRYGQQEGSSGQNGNAQAAATQTSVPRRLTETPARRAPTATQLQAGTQTSCEHGRCRPDGTPVNRGTQCCVAHKEATVRRPSLHDGAEQVNQPALVELGGGPHPRQANSVGHVVGSRATSPDSDGSSSRSEAPSATSSATLRCHLKVREPGRKHESGSRDRAPEHGHAGAPHSQRAAAHALTPAHDHMRRLHPDVREQRRKTDIARERAPELESSALRRLEARLTALERESADEEDADRCVPLHTMKLHVRMLRNDLLQFDASQRSMCPCLQAGGVGGSCICSQWRQHMRPCARV